MGQAWSKIRRWPSRLPVVVVMNSGRELQSDIGRSRVDSAWRAQNEAVFIIMRSIVSRIYKLMGG
jgi:hypothetical protein